MRPIRPAVIRVVRRVKKVDEYDGRIAYVEHPVMTVSCAVLSAAVIVEYTILTMACVPDVATVPGIALTVVMLASLIGSMFRPVWFLWPALIAGEVLMLHAPMVTPLAVVIVGTGFLAYLDTWSGAVATGMLLISTLIGIEPGERRVMVVALQNLTFYCFPLLAGVLLHVIRQHDQDRYLIRRQRDREDTARSLHDTISNDLAYLILRIDHVEAQGRPADEREYRRQLRDLRDAADRAMRHTHAVIDSLEEREPAPSPFPPIRTESMRPEPGQSESTRPAPSASRKSAHAPVHSEVPDEASAASQRNDLQSLIDDEEARLDTLGFTGDSLLGVLPHPLDDDTMRLLTGLMTELYANIAKHADPREWYALSVGFDTNGILVAVSDTAKPAVGADSAAAAGLGLGSGIDRYRALIEETGGSFDVRTGANGHWQLDAVIPNRIG